MTRERHLEEPEILATGEDEQSADEVMFLCMPESCKNHTLLHWIIPEKNYVPYMEQLPTTTLDILVYYLQLSEVNSLPLNGRSFLHRGTVWVFCEMSHNVVHCSHKLL